MAVSAPAPEASPAVSAPRSNSLRIAEEMAQAGIRTVCTLPETWLVDLFQHLETDDRFDVIRVAKEEEGIGIMTGSFFGGGAGALIMSNSGFMTCACALNGLAQRQGIPMLLMIVERGDLGETEVLQGNIAGPTRGVLEALGIRAITVNSEDELERIGQASKLAAVLRQPVAVLLGRKALLGSGVAPKWFLQGEHHTGRDAGRMQRWDVMEFLNTQHSSQLVVAHFGPTRAEWHQISGGRQTLFMYGGMGMASSIGLGLARRIPQRGVWIFEGDGALALNLGSLLTVSQIQPPNLVQFLFCNRTYDAVGSTPLVNDAEVNFPAIARAAGIKNTYSFDNMDDIRRDLPGIIEAGEYAFVNFEVAPGSRATRKMPWDPFESKYRFGREVQALEGIDVFPQ